MNKERFLEILNKADLNYQQREPLLEAVLKEPLLLGDLLKLIRNYNDSKSALAARIFELACKKNISLLLPYLDQFSNILSALKIDAVIRSFAKIIELMAIEVRLKKNKNFINTLSDPHREQIIESCFDWMLSLKPTAIQAHSMYALYLFGLDKPWVHKELSLLIERNLSGASAGYKNRGLKIISALHSNKILKL